MSIKLQKMQSRVIFRCDQLIPSMDEEIIRIRSDKGLRVIRRKDLLSQGENLQGIVKGIHRSLDFLQSSGCLN